MKVKYYKPEFIYSSIDNVDNINWEESNLINNFQLYQDSINPDNIIKHNRILVSGEYNFLHEFK